MYTAMSIVKVFICLLLYNFWYEYSGPIKTLLSKYARWVDKISWFLIPDGDWPNSSGDAGNDIGILAELYVCPYDTPKFVFLPPSSNE